MTSSNLCPCTSGQTYEECCAPFHKGRNPETAEQLLRARYSAFATGKIDYILDTHHPDTRKDVKRDEIEDWSKNSEWQGMQVEGQEPGPTADEHVIYFHARYRSGGKDHDHREKSFFKKHQGVWKFHDAHGVHTGPYVREEAKVGRNDPCPCGSGKKYKKCHAA